MTLALLVCARLRHLSNFLLVSPHVLLKELVYFYVHVGVFATLESTRETYFYGDALHAIVVDLFVKVVVLCLDSLDYFSEVLKIVQVIHLFIKCNMAVVRLLIKLVDFQSFRVIKELNW